MSGHKTPIPLQVGRGNIDTVLTIINIPLSPCGRGQGNIDTVLTIINIPPPLVGGGKGEGN